VRTETRYWIDCTVCGPDADPPVPRFNSERELWQYLFGPDEWGWVRLDDGRILCPAHRRVDQCHRDGHTVSEWTEHPLYDDTEWRYCIRCGARFEQRRDPDPQGAPRRIDPHLERPAQRDAPR
jgi:hypothetical protein